MDILSYIVEGCGRHADSLGNREVYASPGFQWMSVGSGVEHAEGGGTPAGERTHGFQIWLKMPRAKMGERATAPSSTSTSGPARTSPTKAEPHGQRHVLLLRARGTLNGEPFKAQQICRFDTSGGSVKAAVSAGAAGLRMMVFTGR
ncbi:quercetin 2,3-dioxygenase [Aureococcus anophagefferens]|nr:quercetin 2,3-dioxygenase [Aureococcus anophagefferens]